jgi:hypothetical protein
METMVINAIDGLAGWWFRGRDLATRQKISIRNRPARRQAYRTNNSKKYTVIYPDTELLLKIEEEVRQTRPLPLCEQRKLR